MTIPKDPGCRKDPKDKRDFKSKLVLKAIPLPVEFSLENRITKIKTQGESSSCVAQSIAYYAEVLNSFETNQKIQLSARDIYSLIHLPSGGAGIREGLKKLTQTGIVLEADAPSYLGGRPPSEPFMRQRNDITQEEIERGYTYLAKSYVSLPENSFESMKQAIYQNYGCITGALGENKNWLTAFVKPGKHEWGHAIYALGWRIINGKEYIEFINSWGPEWGAKGFGYLGKDYFDAGQIFNPWTVMDFPNSYYENLKKQASILAQMVEIYKKIIALLKK